MEEAFRDIANSIHAIVTLFEKGGIDRTQALELVSAQMERLEDVLDEW